LAVATVTATIARLLGEALAGQAGGAVPNALVTTHRPDSLVADPNARGVNLYLYQVTPSPAWRGNGLPARRADGSVLNPPQQAIDLHYLVTFTGDELTLEPQRLLGATVTALTARPVLTRDLVRATIAQATEANGFLKHADLADQIDLVRMTMQPLDLEEMSKLWSVFFQAQYRLSVTYQATVVLLDAAIPGSSALPVRVRNVDVAPLRAPSLTRVVVAADPDLPVTAGATLRAEGSRLGATSTRVEVAGVTAVLHADQMTDAAIVFDLPAEVPAGVQGVQVVQPRLVGSPPDARTAAESNVVPVLVHPTVTAVTTAPGKLQDTLDISVELNPPVGRQQRIVLSLNERAAAPGTVPRGYTFVAATRTDPAAPDPAPKVTITTEGIRPGEYLVRVQVDGAESPLAVGENGTYETQIGRASCRERV